MLLLTLRDIQFRATRIVFVLLGISVVFTLLLLMTGLAEQFSREPRRTVDHLGAAAWLLPAGASGAFTSGATFDAALLDQVEAPSAAPIVVARDSLREGDGEPADIVVVGIVPGQLGTPELRSGVLPSAPGEAVVDAAAEVGLGDEVLLGGEPFAVVGTTRGSTLFAGMPIVYMTLDDAQEHVYRGQQLISAILVDSTDVTAPEGLQVLAADDVATDAKRPLENAISSVNLIRILLWGVAAMIIGTMVYLTALERRRDFAVMKAVGSPTGALLGGLALQSAAIAVVASIVAAGLQAVIAPIFPLEVTIEGSALVQLPIVAVVVSLVASLAGMRKVLKADPAMAFAGPSA